MDSNNEVDRLRGGPGADDFVLGDNRRRYYDDQSAATPGTDSYAIITDFSPAQGDRLRLFGAVGEYHLGASPIAGIPGAAIYHDSNNNGILDSTADELIALLTSTAEPVTRANTIETAVFEQFLDPAKLIALGAIETIIRNDGTDGRFELHLSMQESIPPGLLFEIQASTDLGVTDRWQTIASKDASDPWSGPAAVTVASAPGGRVTVTVLTQLPIRMVPKQFFRFQLSRSK